MTQELLISIIFINLAFLFYTIAVWSGYIKKKLVLWHSVFFWLGVLTDSIGTSLMVQHVGYIKFTVHTTTGFIGLLLMLFHAFWASRALYLNHETAIVGFQKFSIFVWSIWFASYVSGVVMGMRSVVY